MHDLNKFDILCYLNAIRFTITCQQQSLNIPPHLNNLPSRRAFQDEALDPEEAFEMITACHKTTFRPVYGDTDVLTLQSFDGFEITKQVRHLFHVLNFLL